MGRATDIFSGANVAVKTYKENSSPEVLQRFKWQISVLKDLQAPFVRPRDPKLWSPLLANVSPSNLFVKLLDYSKDSHGNPGPDSFDGKCYVVTEIARRTVHSLIKKHRKQGTTLSESVKRQMVKSLVLVVAGMHAKGYVHLDLKPENVMQFEDGRWKIIDVDGCARVGTTVSKNNQTMSFTPDFCSPELARLAFARGFERKRKDCLQFSSFTFVIDEFVLFVVSTRMQSWPTVQEAWVACRMHSNCKAFRRVH